MVRIAALIAGGVLAVPVLAVGIIAVGMHTGSPVILDAVRRFNKAVTNPRVMRRAGSTGPYGVVHHVGRRTGRHFTTPVEPIAADGGLLIVLPYGGRADWLQNILAAGGGRVTMDGTTVSVSDPEVLPMSDVIDDLPVGQRRMMRVFGVDHCLRLSIGDT